MTKILVIEDENIIRETIMDTLELENYQVAGASDGVQGLTLVQEFHPDLIICDIMMSGLDGYGVLEAIRSNPETGEIPFIFVTAKADRESLRRGMQLGADDYLTKPFTAIELLESISVRLERHQRIAGSSEPRSSGLSPQLMSAINNDLRTPLHSITSTLEFIMRQINHMQPLELQKLLDTVHSESHHLDHTIGQLTFLASLESGELSYSVIQETGNRIPIWEMLIVATSLARRFVNERSDVLVRPTDPDTETYIQCDSKALKHAFAEVLANAFQVAPSQTEVVVSHWQSQGTVWVEISDCGPGFSEKQLATIFGNAAADGKPPTFGAGLGLQLARRIVEAHGGQLKIDSVLGEGTRVLIGLPLAEAV